MDAIRWVTLVLLFAGLLAAWYWSKRQAKLAGPAKPGGAGFKVAQKRWLDQKTGVALVEAEGQSFLLAYTVGGGVSWQPVTKKSDPAHRPEMDAAPADDFETFLSEAGLR